MGKLPIKNDKIGIVFKGEDKQYQLFFAAAVGLDLESQQSDFISAVGGVSPEELGVKHPGSESPREFRKKVIKNKINLVNRGKNIHIKEAMNLFETFFAKYSRKLCQFILEGKKDEAKRYCRDVMANKIRDSIIDAEIFFVKFSELELQEDEHPETGPQDSGSTGSETASSGYDGKTIKVSPVIGLKNGLKVNQASRGDEVLVRPVKGADTDGSNEDEDSDMPVLTGKFLEYEPTGKGEGILRVQLDEGIYGKCTTSPENLLKQKSGSGNDSKDGGDEYYGIILMWMFLCCVIIFGAVALILYF